MAHLAPQAGIVAEVQIAALVHLAVCDERSLPGSRALAMSPGTRGWVFWCTLED